MWKLYFWNKCFWWIWPGVCDKSIIFQKKVQLLCKTAQRKRFFFFNLYDFFCACILKYQFKMKCNFAFLPDLPWENKIFLIKLLLFHWNFFKSKMYGFFFFLFWSALIMINTRHHFILSLFWHMPQIAHILYVGSKNNQCNPGNISFSRCWWKVGQETLRFLDNSAAPCQGASAEGGWPCQLAKLLLSWISNTADMPVFAGFQLFGGLPGHWYPVLDEGQLFSSGPGQ